MTSEARILTRTETFRNVFSIIRNKSVREKRESKHLDSFESRFTGYSRRKTGQEWCLLCLGTDAAGGGGC